MILLYHNCFLSDTNSFLKRLSTIVYLIIIDSVRSFYFESGFSQLTVWLMQINAFIFFFLWEYKSDISTTVLQLLTICFDLTYFCAYLLTFKWLLWRDHIVRSSVGVLDESRDTRSKLVVIHCFFKVQIILVWLWLVPC